MKTNILMKGLFFLVGWVLLFCFWFFCRREKNYNNDFIEKRLKRMENVIIPIYFVQYFTFFVQVCDTWGQLFCTRLIKRKFKFVVSFKFFSFLLSPPLALWNVSSENRVGSWKKSLEYGPCTGEEPESCLENRHLLCSLLKKGQECTYFILM